MRIVIVEPNKKPYAADVIGRLEDFQLIVEGYIEIQGDHNGCLIIGNEEAKIRGLTGNRRWEGNILAGTFFVCGDGGDDFCGLTKAQEKWALERFEQPEEISDEEVQSTLKGLYFFFDN